LPRVPGIDVAEDESPPAPAELPRDGAAVGRFSAQGQSARLRFEARAGECALFELTAFGYARGWTATAGLAVRSAEGQVLVEQERAGPAVFGDLLVFIAPSAGEYELEVRAVEQHFRYVVVRHATYAALPEGGAFEVAVDQTEAHAFTASTGDTLRFVLRGAPGTTSMLRVEPSAERGQKQGRAGRARRAAATAGLADVRLAETFDPRDADDSTYPDLRLRAAESVTHGPFSALVQFPAAGALFVEVEQIGEGPGQLFTLAVERSLTLAPCTVRVGDADDEPLAGVEVVLLREPALERCGRGTTSADGTVTWPVPAGPYTIVYRAPGQRPDSVRTTFTPGVPLNVVAVPRR